MNFEVPLYIFYDASLMYRNYGVVKNGYLFGENMQIMENHDSYHFSAGIAIQNDGNGPIDLESQIPDHHNAMDDMQRSIDLQKAMHHLDQKELRIIKERYFEGFTQSEIAKDLMISQAQVSRIEKQALSHLKKYMTR